MNVKTTFARKPVIAVDIDDVLAAEAEFIINYSNRYWGHTLSLDDYQEHWAALWNTEHEETERRANILHKPGIVKQYRLLENAHEVLQGLRHRYRLTIVTSRRSVVRDETLEWLEENFADVFTSVTFTGFYDQGKPGSHLLTKADLLKEIDAKYLIDDQPKHCFGAAERGIAAVLFGDYGVSRQLKLPLGVTRCKDWLAVQEYFDGRDD